MKKFTAIIVCLVVSFAMMPGWDLLQVVYADDTDGQQTEEPVDPSEPADDPIEPHVHQYTSKVTLAPTCTKDGQRTFTCSCGDSYVEPVPKLGHKYKTSVVKKAKCTKAGKKKYRCTRCGHTYYKKIPKLGHKYKTKTLRKATCTHKGKVKYKCKRCGKKFNKKTPKKVHHPKKKNGHYVCRTCGTRIKKLSKYQKTLVSRDLAVAWAKRIANDNSFHYGKSKWAHHNGCYFCGTNQNEGSSKRKDGASMKECAKTYCCNPFVTAAYCHGAGAIEVDCKVKSKRFGLAYDSNKVVQHVNWKQVKKPSKSKSLMVGDILLTPTHAMLYAGNGYVIHAVHHDNGVRGKYWNESIGITKLSKRQWSRTKKIYRYMGIGWFQKRPKPIEPTEPTEVIEPSEPSEDTETTEPEEAAVQKGQPSAPVVGDPAGQTEPTVPLDPAAPSDLDGQIDPTDSDPTDPLDQENPTQ